MEPAGTVAFGGQVMLGGVMSTTVTVKEQVAVLPPASVTRNVLVVMPSKNAPPDPKPDVCVVVGLAQLSVPTGVV